MVARADDKSDRKITMKDEELRWTCEACKIERPDRFISVLSYPIANLPGGTRNVRYCNDRDACYWIAKKKATTGRI